MKKLISDRKIRTHFGISFKLLVSTAFLILSSVFFVSFFSYAQYTKDFQAQSSARVQQILNLVSLNINTYFDDLFKLSLSPYYNQNVIDALDKSINDSDLKSLDRTRTVEGFLDEMMIMPRNDILRVFIVTDNIYKSERIDTPIDYSTEYKNSQWYKKAMETQKPVFIPAHLEEMVKYPKNTVFSVVNVIRSTRNTDRVLGVIKVDANFSGIQTICNKINVSEKGGIFIIDDNKNIIFSNIADIPYDKFYEKVLGSKGSSTTMKFNKDNWLLNSQKVPRSNWTIIAVNSLSEINSNSKKTRNMGVLLSFLFAGLAIIVLIIFMKWFLKPLLYIVKQIREIQDGNLSVTFPEKQNDEIGYLGSSLNKMVKNLNSMIEENTTLVKEVYEAKFLQKEAQIRMLFNQIRPHFIYNTLNMISMMIQCDKSEEAISNINRLSSLLRGMAHWDKDITLEQEIKLLEAYLSIQKSRYEERLEYKIDIDKSLYQYIIPALIMQPIVENAVIHCCESRRDKTIITIWNSYEDNLIINIMDNGNGIPVEILNNLKYSLDNYDNSSLLSAGKMNTSSGIGLINVNRRLKLKYGKEFGIVISSTIGQGTLVKIILPKTH